MKSISSSARSAAFAMLGLALSTAAHGQVHPEKPTYDYEKCYGVARAGGNDCFTQSNSCGGASQSDAQKDAWIYLPKGTCERIVGGSLSPEDEGTGSD